jgi:hypothetical protein
MSAPRFVPLDAALFREAIELVRPDLASPALAMVDGAPPPPFNEGSGWAMIEGGYLLGAGGAVEVWPGRAVLWLLPSIFARRRHLAIAYRFARNWLAELDYRRLEATATEPSGCLFLARLGFIREATLRAYGPDGADHALYARVKP